VNVDSGSEGFPINQFREISGAASGEIKIHNHLLANVGLYLVEVVHGTEPRRQGLHNLQDS
jgi:hypothetical protein